MAMNVTPFKSTDEFTMAGFNGKLADINSGVNDEVASALSGLAHIETGSYTGNGKYGASNPITLNFSFTPKFLFVTCGGEPGNWFFWVPGTTQSSGNWNDSSTVISATGKSVTWYNTNDAKSQRNISSLVYHYIAIG